MVRFTWRVGGFNVCLVWLLAVAWFGVLLLPAVRIVCLVCSLLDAYVWWFGCYVLADVYCVILFAYCVAFCRYCLAFPGLGL